MKILACVLALSTFVLGILCAVQWKQLSAAQARARAVEAALRANAESRETQAAQVRNLEQANQRPEHDAPDVWRGQTSQPCAAGASKMKRNRA